MTAVLDAVAEIARPADAAAELARLNALLAGERTIPEEVADAVHELAAGVARETAMSRWEAVDPYLALVVHRSVIRAGEAVRGGDRDELRVALESLRQAFAAIAENEPVADERSPKEIARWLTETAEVPQSRLAELLGVSLRQFQRWVSTTEETRPGEDDARRLRAVARIVNQLRFALTPAGAIDWFGWQRDDLGGRAPVELLDEPGGLPELAALAGSMRSTYAA